MIELHGIESVNAVPLTVPPGPTEPRKDAEEKPEKGDLVSEDLQDGALGVLTREAAVAATSDLNTVVRQFGNEIQFEVSQNHDRLVIKVIDRESEEVIREIPPEEVLDIHAKIAATLGLIFDKER